MKEVKMHLAAAQTTVANNERKTGSSIASSSSSDDQILRALDHQPPSSQSSPPQQNLASSRVHLPTESGANSDFEKRRLKIFVEALRMSYDNNTPPGDDAGAPEKTQSPSHPSPPPFNPMQPSHGVPNPHVHSVVPDLMRVYESLTKGNPTSQEEQQQQLSQNPRPSQSQQQRQDVQAIAYYQEPEAQAQARPPFQSQHVNYAFITSEEQYRQIYQHQTSDKPSSGDPISQHNYPGQIVSSLPHIPAPYDSATDSSNMQSAEAHPLGSQNPHEPPSPRSSRSSLRRKRSSISLEQDVETSSNASVSGSGKSKNRKKAKETDGRWSKRFTWPEELHRDFVSAVFDVGLKHSSPSTVLEHMPKHPQITSERIKSHLQKYRVHRNKSKQEFMSSYEVSLKKFKNGDMDNVKSLTDGEVAAHLSHATLTEGACGANVPPNARSTAKEAGQTVEDQNKRPQKVPGAFPVHRTGPPPPDHEALMLPKLTETEKSSPIGASMGYLLGLFFSLKKQLLMQRNANAAASRKQPGLPGSQPESVDVSNSGPVVAVYNSFAGTNVLANPDEAAAIMAANSMEWGDGATGGAAPSHPPGSNPHVQNVATLNNLEASSMMKREMQNQMAFQNKMRALKQQELNKYKNVASNQQSNGLTQQIDPNQHVRFKPEEGTITSYQESPLINQAAKKDQNEAVPGSADGERMGPESYHSSTITSMHPSQEHQRDGESKYEEHSSTPEGDPNINIQGAGETARAPSFSMGGNEDFWSGDVMDEQLFEFLMNN
jgi:SHAQKYF class myb-like DNA-binding protein